MQLSIFVSPMIQKTKELMVATLRIGIKRKHYILGNILRSKKKVESILSTE